LSICCTCNGNNPTLGCFSWSFSFEWLRLWFWWACISPVSNLVAVLILDLRFSDHLLTFISTFVLFSHLQKFQMNNYVGSFPRTALIRKSWERAYIQLDIDEKGSYNLEVKNHEIFFEGNMEQKKNLTLQVLEQFPLGKYCCPLVWFGC